MNEPRYIKSDSDRFPEPLRHVNPPVEGLWVLGPDPMDERLVAVVGTRRPTPYGIEIATNISRDLAMAGVTVVSGLAIGIDRAAHVGTLSNGGRTIAVVAGGVDVPMPPQNRRLYTEILRSGGSVVSERSPGDPSYKVRYLERNRIIAAMSAAVVVVQAGARSGATSTANRALDFGVELFAVPGDLRAEASIGVHELLRNHAHVCTSASDVMRVLGWEVAPKDEADGGEQQPVLAAIRGGASTIDSLVKVTGQPASVILRAVASLELSGHLICEGSRYIARM